MTKTLKAAVSAIVLVASLAAQTALATKANALEPIKGSITFQGQPRTKLLKSLLEVLSPTASKTMRKLTGLGKTGRWRS